MYIQNQDPFKQSKGKVFLSATDFRSVTRRDFLNADSMTNYKALGLKTPKIANSKVLNFNPLTFGVGSSIDKFIMRLEDALEHLGKDNFDGLLKELKDILKHPLKNTSEDSINDPFKEFMKRDDVESNLEGIAFTDWFVADTKTSMEAVMQTLEDGYVDSLDLVYIPISLEKRGSEEFQEQLDKFVSSPDFISFPLDELLPVVGIGEYGRMKGIKEIKDIDKKYGLQRLILSKKNGKVIFFSSAPSAVSLVLLRAYLIAILFKPYLHDKILQMLGSYLKSFKEVSEMMSNAHFHYTESGYEKLLGVLEKNFFQLIKEWEPEACTPTEEDILNLQIGMYKQKNVLDIQQKEEKISEYNRTINTYLDEISQVNIRLDNSRRDLLALQLEETPEEFIEFIENLMASEEILNYELITSDRQLALDVVVKQTFSNFEPDLAEITIKNRFKDTYLRIAANIYEARSNNHNSDEINDAIMSIILDIFVNQTLKLKVKAAFRMSLMSRDLSGNGDFANSIVERLDINKELKEVSLWNQHIYRFNCFGTTKVAHAEILASRNYSLIPLLISNSVGNLNFADGTVVGEFFEKFARLADTDNKDIIDEDGAEYSLTELITKRLPEQPEPTTVPVEPEEPDEPVEPQVQPEPVFEELDDDDFDFDINDL